MSRFSIVSHWTQAGLELWITRSWFTPSYVPSRSPSGELVFGWAANEVLFFWRLKDVERVMGCTGSPEDSHDIRWYTIHKDKLLRCGECGSGEPHAWVSGATMSNSSSFSLQAGLPRSGGRRSARSPLKGLRTGAGISSIPLSSYLPHFFPCRSLVKSFFLHNETALLMCIELHNTRDEKVIGLLVSLSCLRPSLSRP